MKRRFIFVIIISFVLIFNSCSVTYLMTIPKHQKERKKAIELTEKIKDPDFKKYVLETMPATPDFTTFLLLATGDIYTYTYFNFYSNPENVYKITGTYDRSSLIITDIIVGGLWGLGVLSNLIDFFTPSNYEYYKTQDLSTKLNDSQLATDIVYQYYYKKYLDYLEYEKGRKKQIEEQKKREEEMRKKEIERLKEQYGKWWEYVDKKTIVIGMPAWIVEDIFGKPSSVNKTVTASTVYEQWVYERYNYALNTYWPYLYLYFENGVLTSWQETN
ncbi:hypothetical protein LN42_01795 [Marinitoga sp. 1137]|uniref:hypothetical protein n=1 Tax=Marinitoga sp. 1137 TaxID=1545835 RepID=UPI0009509236|nr:hypothetical protein [Marinitoga sp. 1137]APT75265.1 hypothetical protein LN42_01795 [Marinitoga sp. 1137]